MTVLEALTLTWQIGSFVGAGVITVWVVWILLRTLWRGTR